MIETYLLTVLQMDAINRVYRYACEKEADYAEFVRRTYGGGANYDRDIALLDVLHQDFKDCYRYARMDQTAFFIRLIYGEQSREALDHALQFFLAGNMSLRQDEGEFCIVLQNFPDFNSRVEHKTTVCGSYYTIPERETKLVPDPV